MTTTFEHAERVQVKFFAERAPETTEFIPIFHAWIRDKRIQGDTLVDVADYSHVADGPGVMLVGHGCDWYLDEHYGRRGLLFSRKRAFEGDFKGSFEDALRQAEQACIELEKDVDASFSTTELLIRVPDRLHVSNTDEDFEAIAPLLKASIAAIAGAEPTLEREGEARQCLTVRARFDAPPKLQDFTA
ncbi:MAG: hypothetical protein AAF938_24730 [Myxococcota bacterium]